MDLLFEFYGTIENGMSYDINGNMSKSSYAGMFCYWNGNEKGTADFRFGKHSRYIKWNAGRRKKNYQIFRRLVITGI